MAGAHGLHCNPRPTRCIAYTSLDSFVCSGPVICFRSYSCSAVTKRDCDPLYLMRAYLNTLRVVCAQQPNVFVVHCLAAGNLLALRQPSNLLVSLPPALV